MTIHLTWHLLFLLPIAFVICCVLAIPAQARGHRAKGESAGVVLTAVVIMLMLHAAIIYALAEQL